MRQKVTAIKTAAGWVEVGNFHFQSDNLAAIPSPEQVERAEQVATRTFRSLSPNQRAQKVAQLAMAIRSTEQTRDKLTLAPAHTSVRTGEQEFVVTSLLKEGSVEHTVLLPAGEEE